MSDRLKNITAENSLRQNAKAGKNAEDIIKSFYKDHRDEFINFGMRYNMDKDNLIDIFQDVVIIFFEQKEAGKIDELKCSDKTYLFSIGKYKIIEFLRKNRNKSILPNDQLPDGLVDPKIIEEESLSDNQKLLVSGLKQLGKRCREIVTLFYYRQLTISEIATQMEYKNENVVKAHKSRCMKSLKEIVIKMTKA